jgi:hypothetical protein
MGRMERRMMSQPSETATTLDYGADPRPRRLRWRRIAVVVVALVAAGLFAWRLKPATAARLEMLAAQRRCMAFTLPPRTDAVLGLDENRQRPGPIPQKDFYYWPYECCAHAFARPECWTDMKGTWPAWNRPLKRRHHPDNPVLFLHERSAGPAGPARLVIVEALMPHGGRGPWQLDWRVIAPAGWLGNAKVVDSGSLPVVDGCPQRVFFGQPDANDATRFTIELADAAGAVTGAFEGRLNEQGQLKLSRRE